MAAGHTAVTKAVRQVDETVQAAGLSMGGPARSALSTRLAGPGAHPRLLDEVLSWLELRDTVADVARLGVGARRWVRCWRTRSASTRYCTWALR